MKPAINTPLKWSEDKLQASFFTWFHNTFPHLRGLLFAVPNGSLRGGLEGKVLKATGLWSGVADMIFLWKGKSYFLELKRPDGKNDQSPEQVAWEILVKHHGFEYTLYNDLKELKLYILNIIVDSDVMLNTPNKQLDIFKDGDKKKVINRR